MRLVVREVVWSQPVLLVFGVLGEGAQGRRSWFRPVEAQVHREGIRWVAGSSDYARGGLGGGVGNWRFDQGETATSWLRMQGGALQESQGSDREEAI